MTPQNEWIVMDRPGDTCFGCGQDNEHGLRMRFRKTEGGVESEYTVPDKYNGSTGVVHGGVQAALIDEVMGVSVHVALGEDDTRIVTAEFKLRYRRPVPTNTPLLIRGRVVRREDPNLFCEAEICDEAGEVLTRAEARWRTL